MDRYDLIAVRDDGVVFELTVGILDDELHQMTFKVAKVVEFLPIRACFTRKVV